MPAIACTAAIVALAINPASGMVNFQINSKICKDSDGSFEYAYEARGGGGSRTSSRNVTWPRTHELSKTDVTDQVPLKPGERIEPMSVKVKNYRCTCYATTQ